MQRANGAALVQKLGRSTAISGLQPAAADSADDLKAKGVEFFKADRLSEAGHFFRSALGSRPKFAEAHNNLGMVLRKRGRPQSAIAAFQTALMLNPRSTSTYGNLGNLHERYGNLPQAEFYYLKAVELDPDLHQAFIGLARIAAQRQRWDDSLSALSRASQILPKSVSVIHQMGAIYIAKGDLSAAREQLRNAMSLDPEHVGVRASLSDVLMRLGDTRQAKDLADWCLEREPDNAVALEVKRAIEAGETPSSD